ncbi:hypothetical protein ISCGN_017979 [Ixodes scapularis]
MRLRHTPFALLRLLLLAALGQSPLVSSAQLFVPFEQVWRTGVRPIFDEPSVGDGLSAVFVAAPALSATIRFPTWQQGTASAAPLTSWGGQKRAHFDATSGHDAAMRLRHSPFALLRLLLLAALGQSPLVSSAQLFVSFEQVWRTGVRPIFDEPSVGDGLSAVFVAAPALSATIRFPTWQQRTASAVPLTSWGGQKRAHFDATSGHDAAMRLRHSPFALLQLLLLAALGQSPLVSSAQLFVPFEQVWRTGVRPIFDEPSVGDGLSAVFVAAPALSATIRFPTWQQGTASAVPLTSWGGQKRAHFDATSGHDAAMRLRHSPFALLRLLLLAALGQSPLVSSAQLFVPFEQVWRTGVRPIFDEPSVGDGLSAVFVAAPALSATIRFPTWQQGTASAVPLTSWGGQKRAHFDATSGHDAAMRLRHSPFALLQLPQASSKTCGTCRRRLVFLSSRDVRHLHESMMNSS